MACGDDLKTLLSRFVDGELPPEERARVEDHLLSCEPCRELVSLFQKNENLLASALSTDAFGDAVIESVVRRIERTGPPEAKPVEEGVIEWVRSRPWLQLAAAVLLVVGLLAMMSSSHSRQMAALQETANRANAFIAKQTEEQKKSESEIQAQRRAASELAEQLGRLERRQRAEDAFRRAPEGSLWGFLETDHYLVIKASFEGKGYTGFNVWRRGENDKPDAFGRLNDKVLATPEYTDRAVKPGQGYVYRFQAIRPNGEMVDSMPLYMRLPFAGDLSPEKTVRIYCENLSAPKDLGVFVLERLVNGKPVSARFYVELGKPIGGQAEVGGSVIDFSTDLVLTRIENDTQPLLISYTTPVLDEQGKPMMDRIVGDVFVPKYFQYDVSIGSRENRRAVLKLTGTSSKATEESLWKGSFMRVRARGD